MLRRAHGPGVAVPAEVLSAFEEGPVNGMSLALDLPDLSRGMPRREGSPSGGPSERAAHWATFALHWLLVGSLVDEGRFIAPYLDAQDGDQAPFAATWRYAEALQRDAAMQSALLPFVERQIGQGFGGDKASLVAAWIGLEGGGAEAAARATERLAFLLHDDFCLDAALCLPSLARHLLGGALARHAALDATALEAARGAIDSALGASPAPPPPARTIAASFLASYSQLTIEGVDAPRLAAGDEHWQRAVDHERGVSERPGSIAFATPGDSPEVEVVLSLGAPAATPRGKPVAERVGSLEVAGPITVRGVAFETTDRFAPPAGPYAVRARFFAKKVRGADDAYRVLVELHPAAVEAVSARDRLILDELRRQGIEGPLPDLAGLAGWVDYQNHDGTTAAELRGDLERLAAAGWLALADGRYRLLRA
ncbi:MAG: hypothetical protein U1F43_11185 [Myxococcota bacterium]